jgi:hypothetical protein
VYFRRAVLVQGYLDSLSAATEKFKVKILQLRTSDLDHSFNDNASVSDKETEAA